MNRRLILNGEDELVTRVKLEVTSKCGGELEPPAIVESHRVGLRVGFHMGHAHILADMGKLANCGSGRLDSTALLAARQMPSVQAATAYFDLAQAHRRERKSWVSHVSSFVHAYGHLAEVVALARESC